MTQIIKGIILQESLASALPSSVRVTGKEQWKAENSTPGQPEDWTALTFEVSTNNPDIVATSLSDVIKKGPWYTNFTTKDGSVFVIFAGKVIQYRSGDPQGRVLATDYARQQGIPESQLDWIE